MLVHMTIGAAVSSMDQEFFKSLGERIANSRKSHELTQQQVADRLGIAQQTYAQYEVGIRRIPASMLPTLAQEFGLTLDELMGQCERPRSRPGPVPKLQQQIERIRHLPKTKQQVLMEILDGFLTKTGN